MFGKFARNATLFLLLAASVTAGSNPTTPPAPPPEGVRLPPVGPDTPKPPAPPTPAPVVEPAAPIRAPKLPTKEPAPAPKPVIVDDLPPVVVKLTKAQFYVVDSDIPLVVTSSPPGLIKVVQDEGPVRLRGVFVDGDGSVETRTYKGKIVSSIELTPAALEQAKTKTVQFEVLIIPGTVAKESDIVRRTLEVDIGKPPAPTPPEPGPEPKPKPDDNTPRKVKGPVHVSLVVDFENQTAAVNALVNDADMRGWFKGKTGYNLWVVSTRANAYTADSVFKSAADKPGLPSVVIQDGKGTVLESFKLTSAAEVTKAAAKYVGE